MIAPNLDLAGVGKPAAEAGVALGIRDAVLGRTIAVTEATLTRGHAGVCGGGGLWMPAQASGWALNVPTFEWLNISPGPTRYRHHRARRMVAPWSLAGLPLPLYRLFSPSINAPTSSLD